MSQTIRIGTSGSELGLWQSHQVVNSLRQAFPEIQLELHVYGKDDPHFARIDGRNGMRKELERALVAGEVDCTVHSMKDLSTQNYNEALGMAFVPRRAAVHDVLISKDGLTLEQLPKGAKIGTDSRRRIAQLRHFRQDLEMIAIQGNVTNRLQQALAPDSPYDAIVLAQLGLEALGKMDKVTQIIPLEIMLPFPAQGTIFVQCRHSEGNFHADWWLEQFPKLSDYSTYMASASEMNFLHTLELGHALAVAAYAENNRFQARILSLDGSEMVEISELYEEKFLCGFGKSNYTEADWALPEEILEEESRYLNFFVVDLVSKAFENGVKELLEASKKKD